MALLAKVEGENSIKVKRWGGRGHRFSSYNVCMRGGVGTLRVDMWYTEILSPHGSHMMRRNLTSGGHDTLSSKR